MCSCQPFECVQMRWVLDVLYLANLFCVLGDLKRIHGGDTATTPVPIPVASLDLLTHYKSLRDGRAIMGVFF